MASTMSQRAVLKNALAAGEKGIGYWLTFPGPSVVRSLTSIPGFNWVLIDGEHGQISDKDFYELSNAVAACGASPIIRVPNAEEWMIKRALDSGAHGIMTPMCHTAEDAKRIVAWNKYPPTGTRGFGPMFAGHSFGAVEGDYAAQADAALLVMVQIESQAGVDNVEAIAQVPGLDVLFVGPFDLSNSMGVPFGSDAHQAAIARILKAAHDHGKTAAIFCSNGEQARQRLAMGFDMVSIHTDIGVIVQGMTRELGIATGSTQQPKKGGGYS